MRKSAPIGQLLINGGHISQDQLDRALEVQKQAPDKRLGDIVVELGYVTQRTVTEEMARAQNLQFIDLRQYNIEPNALNTINAQSARHFKMVPIDFLNNMLVVATADPLDYYSFDEIAAMSGRDVSIVMATLDDINWVIDHFYNDNTMDSVVDDINNEFGMQEADAQATDEDDELNDNAVVKLVNTIVAQSYMKGASDIHIEPFEKTLNVRIRINGDLINHSTMNITALNSIVTRIKILSGMNIAEKRVPQDGRFKFNQNNIHCDLRVSAMPTIHGEKIVLRLLSNDASKEDLLSVKNLGMEPENEAKLEKMLKSPNGVIFVTGPTGSGKTTTLYAALSELVKKNVNVITVEDPVEKPLAGVNQVQTNDKAGMTFAAALKAILRQDPDVIMIGEIRDGETAAIGIRAAITGHLVLATIHTNDAVSTIIRVVDMGIEPYLIGSAISGIIAQRLLKKLCPNCKQQVELTEMQQELIDHKATSFYDAVGCEQCNFTGYKGRLAIYEVVDVDGKFRELISKGEDTSALKAYQKSIGVKFLKDRAIDAAMRGVTNFSEIEKIIYSID
ncbi:MAG: Flp pilus assembly complex ATPase component TadA [Firmicutes bacterium]|nr:Flp pilus assembly complex ATPase component TadA [Bacillota bacterium]